MKHDRARLRALPLALFAGIGFAACNSPSVKDAPASPASPTSIASATASDPVPTTNAAPSASADAGSPTASKIVPIDTKTWTTLSTAKKSITVRYPADVFPKTKATGESLVLSSTLSRGLLGEGNGSKVHRFEIHVDWLSGTPFDAVKKDFKAYPFPQMFPAGTEASFVELEGEGARVTLAGHAGYRVHTGVEGYDENTVMLAIEPKKTLRFRCTYVGNVMGPEITEDRQVALCDAVLDALTTSSIP